MTGQQEYRITDEELRKFFDAWMFSTKDVRELHRINDNARSRPVHEQQASLKDSGFNERGIKE